MPQLYNMAATLAQISSILAQFSHKFRSVFFHFFALFYGGLTEVACNIRPRHLEPLVRVVAVPNGKHSSPLADCVASSSDHLVMPTVKFSTAGGRVFSAAAPQTGNDLPNNDVSVKSLSSFHWPLKAVIYKDSPTSFSDHCFMLSHTSGLLNCISHSGQCTLKIKTGQVRRIY